MSSEAPSPSQKIMGERIKKRRLELGLTQERLADEAQISKGFLSDVETGTRKPSAEYLLLIANVLKVSLDYLMKGEDSSPAAPAANKIKIPGSLSDFALEAGLSYEVVKSMLEARLRIVANRRNTVDDDLEHFNWRGFYNAMKDYL